MLIQTYFYPAHSISTLKNVAMLSFTVKKSVYVFVCFLYLSNKTMQPPSMSTNVVVDPRTFLFCDSLIAFLGINATWNHKEDFPFPDFSRFFPPLEIFVSHQTVNLKGILSHVSVSENEVSLCKYEFAKFLGPCSKLPPIYQGFCREERPKNSHKMKLLC